MNTLINALTTERLETLLRAAEAEHAKLPQDGHDWVPFYAEFIMNALADAEEKSIRLAEAQVAFKATTLALL